MTETTTTTDYVTALGRIFPPAVRAMIYLTTVMLAAAYAVVEANVDLHWGWMAGYAAWNAGAAVLAAVNTTATTGAVRSVTVTETGR